MKQQRACLTAYFLRHVSDCPGYTSFEVISARHLVTFRAVTVSWIVSPSVAYFFADLPQQGENMKPVMKFIDAVYTWLLRGANALQAPFLLAVRLYWGWQLWQTGHGKLADMAKVVDFFTSLGIPAPSLNAHFIALLEAVGGILLILGLGSRTVSLLLAADMTVAFIVADREALGAIFTDPDKFYAAAPYTFLFASLLVLIFGPGWLSLDTLIARFRKKRQTEQPQAQSI
jgi:putative oxidoreductase